MDTALDSKEYSARGEYLAKMNRLIHLDIGVKWDKTDTWAGLLIKLAEDFDLHVFRGVQDEHVRVSANSDNLGVNGIYHERRVNSLSGLVALALCPDTVEGRDPITARNQLKAVISDPAWMWVQGYSRANGFEKTVTRRIPKRL